MSSSRHTCNCDFCRDGRTAKKELQGGGTDLEVDNDSPMKYRKSKKHNRKRCPKSKTGEACNTTGRKTKGTKKEYDYLTQEWMNKPRTITCCSRCGREILFYLRRPWPVNPENIDKSL